MLIEHMPGRKSRLQAKLGYTLQPSSETQATCQGLTKTHFQGDCDPQPASCIALEINYVPRTDVTFARKAKKKKKKCSLRAACVSADTPQERMGPAGCHGRIPL